ncbi:type II toxin-antitoxin system VapC family toxin [Actinokineospora sp.]|uniref:type II toxin-antitoxin system VapC family toxin n=1 Tax=Actinokineospora sp. TaxID=1872133 RepID=UPI00403820AF
MGAVVLDASVVIAVFDPLDAHHLSAIEVVRGQHVAGSQFVVPSSVLAEVLVGEARRDGGIVDHRLAAVNRLFGTCRPVDQDVAVAAAQLLARHRALRLPDALVIATGIVENATVILTADKRWAEIDDRITVLGDG